MTILGEVFDYDQNDDQNDEYETTNMELFDYYHNDDLNNFEIISRSCLTTTIMMIKIMNMETILIMILMTTLTMKMVILRELFDYYHNEDQMMNMETISNMLLMTTSTVIS